ncbi:cation:proton antiporter [Rhodoligotrophos ferricapiens]|uniref:cation:proton antiporter n=1 Tax=Rhodoligotrophos ferricapiens TaxID=3069264 RepID=UPI00315C4FCE
MHLYFLIANFAALLVVVSLAQPLAARAKLSASVLLAIVGILTGVASQILVDERFGGGLGEIASHLADLPIDSHVFLSIFLPVLLFQTALTMDLRQLAEDAAPIFSLAVLAVIAATFTIGLLLWPFAGLPLVACLMLGSIVATTDPVAVVGIFRDVSAPSRLVRLVEGESLLNDAAAITLFTLLLGFMLTNAHASLTQGFFIFLQAFLGGIVFGGCAGWLMSRLLPLVRDFRLAQVSLSVALPYLVFTLGEEQLKVSGVVAVVVAGLVFALQGPRRVRPDDWSYLREVWEQIEFWASSMVFVLAALLIPRLLIQVEWSDIGLLGLVIIGALLSRAAVLFGVLPLLSFAKLSEKISTSFKLVILWGGLRGAITLALALAVTENNVIPPEIQRFVAVLATGFVLFTLLFYGTTLRPLVRLLKLDRLSPFDAALQAQVLANAQADLTERTAALALSYGIDPTAADGLFARDKIEAEKVWAELADNDEIADRHRIILGLIALARRESQLVQDKFRSRAVSPEAAAVLLRHAARLMDQARAGGRYGYNRAARDLLGFSWRIRLAQLVHRLCGIDRLLASLLSQRFERLMVIRIVLDELSVFTESRIRPVLGPRVAKLLAEILDSRKDATTSALDALKLQYPTYAVSLERRILSQSVVRTQALEYERLLDEGLIGPELYSKLRQGLSEEQRRSESLPSLDLGLNTRELVGHVPLFAGLTDEQKNLIADLLIPHFAMPGEVLIREGERGSTMYFISSGAVRVAVGSKTFNLGRGEFFGEFALLSHSRRQATVTALSYCQLLILKADDLANLMQRFPDIKAEIDAVAARRQAINREIAHTSF